MTVCSVPYMVCIYMYRLFDMLGSCVYDSTVECCLFFLFVLGFRSVFLVVHDARGWFVSCIIAFSRGMILDSAMVRYYTISLLLLGGVFCRVSRPMAQYIKKSIKHPGQLS